MRAARRLGGILKQVPSDRGNIRMSETPAGNAQRVKVDFAAETTRPGPGLVLRSPMLTLNVLHQLPHSFRRSEPYCAPIKARPRDLPEESPTQVVNRFRQQASVKAGRASWVFGWSVRTAYESVLYRCR